MIVPTLCPRCSEPLDAESVSGLCPVCLAYGASSQSPTLPNRAASAASGTPPSVPAWLGRGQQATHDTSELPGTVPAGAVEAERRAKPPAPPHGYELVQRLGSGGMGEVYLARDLAAQRLVAMKFLRHPAERSAFDRFLVELRAMAGVDHPGVVRVYTSDFQARDPYFTMEYVAGESLGARLLRDGPLEPTEAARVVAGAARAVQAAHDAGVVHRDLKPSNILLTEDGRPKVSDFGLAKRTNYDDGLTTTSGPVGTPAYMAPEQASRHFGNPGPRADVYGLGATLYHLLTGQPPFRGSTADAVARLLTSVPERPRAVRPDIPRGLEAVVVKCLEKRPDRRYASAAELADDLDRFLAGRKTLAPELTWPRRVWRACKPRLAPAALAVAILAAVFALGAAVWPGGKSDADPPPDPVEEARKDLAAGRAVTLVGAKGGPKYARWLLETDTLGPSPQNDESCHFVAMGHSLLELFPAPGIKKYRIDLELQHLQSPIFIPDPGVEPDFLGVYVGYASLALPEAKLLHNLFGVIYTDADYAARRAGTPPQPQPIALHQFTFLQQPGQIPASSLAQGPPITFAPSNRWPSPWRSMRIECSPDGATAYWKDDKGKWVLIDDLGPARLQARLVQLRDGRNFHFRGAGERLPLWEPDAPFGIIAYKASLSFKNVVITPLP